MSQKRTLNNKERTNKKHIKHIKHTHTLITIQMLTITKVKLMV